MDLTLDFEVPLKPSQTIVESDSDPEINQTCDTSPIFRRNRRRSRKSRDDREKIIEDLETSPEIKRRSFKCSFRLLEDHNCDNKEDSNKENEVSSTSPENVDQSGDALSQVVSSCNSSSGLVPQPIENRNYSLSASVLVTNFVDNDALDDHNDEGEETANCGQGSEKKKRKVKNGLVEHFDRILEEKKSKESLEKYQLDAEQLSGEVTMKVLKVVFINDVIFVSGQDYYLVINSDFCSRVPSVNDIISFSHPRITKLVNDRKVLLGVLNMSVVNEADNNVLGDNEVAPAASVKSLRCPCLAGDSCHGVQLLNINISDQETREECSWSSPSLQQSSPGEENQMMSVTDLVSTFRGTSSSPQSKLRLSYSRQLSLHLIIHNISSQGGSDQVQSLICECCLSGEFIIVKLSSHLRDSDCWKDFFCETVSLAGSRVKLTSPFNMQDRLTRSRNHKLFSVIDSFKPSLVQRFCYVIKCCQGSRLQLLNSQEVLSAVIDLSSTDLSPDDKDRRVNVRVTILYFHQQSNILYITSQINLSNYRKVLFKNPTTIEDWKRRMFPMTADLLCMTIEPSGLLSLDAYSSVTNVHPVQVSVRDMETCAPGVGDLVKIEGMVTKVNEQLSCQWLQCTSCGSDKLDQDRCCVDCGQENGEPEHRVEMVCRVGGMWTRLSRSSKLLLPSHQSSIHPADVIGQIVPPTLAIVDDQGVAEECVNFRE